MSAECGTCGSDLTPPDPCAYCALVEENAALREALNRSVCALCLETGRLKQLGNPEGHPCPWCAATGHVTPLLNKGRAA